MFASCGSILANDSSTANLYQQEAVPPAVCTSISNAYKLRGMNKPVRTPLTPEQDQEAKRLKAIFNARKDAARARGGMGRAR